MATEVWSLEVKIGGEWTIRHQSFTKERLLQQADMYVGRALESGYEVRIAPYTIDASRIELLESMPTRRP